MSNVTPNSRKSGDSRRRNSRGGRNRNHQNENRRGGDRGERGERGERGNRGPGDSGGAGRAEEFRLQSPRPPRGSKPVKLTFWQKLLKAIGLYKEPVRPPRPERKPRVDGPQGESRPPKSNTRNARTEGGDVAEPRERSEERPPGRPKRGNRGDGERPRGGDRSTVESPRVYVGNLSYDVTEQDLQELFKGVGPVRNVEIVYNRSTHRSKGYGFVEMLRMDEAMHAVEVLNDQHFMGRKLTVSGAKSKGMDEREEAEDRPTRESHTVALAPLPKPAEPAGESPEETPAAVADASEPVIQTVVETVTAAEPETTAHEEASAETESGEKKESA